VGTSGGKWGKLTFIPGYLKCLFLRKEAGMIEKKRGRILSISNVPT